MLKKILSVKQVVKLSKEKQRTINGGVMIYCNDNSDCPSNWVCSGGGFCCPSHY